MDSQKSQSQKAGTVVEQVDQVAQGQASSFNLTKQYSSKFNNGDATPSVQNVCAWQCGSGVVTISNFRNGQEGQTIRLLGNSNTTIQNNTFIVTSTGADIVLVTNSIYVFTKYGSKWYQECCDTGGGGGGVGPPGSPGRDGITGFSFDGVDGEDGMIIPGPAGLSGTAGSSGATGPAGPPGFGIDGIDGEDALMIPGPPGVAGAFSGGANVLYDSGALAVDTASIDTGANGIAGTYRLLEIHLLLRTDEVVSSSVINAIFNNDSGNNYDRQYLDAALGVVSSSGASVGVAAMQFGCSGASATASYFTVIIFRVPFYTDVNAFKTALAAHGQNSPQGYTNEAYTWKNTAAITRFGISTNTAGKKFKAGSRMVVLGVDGTSLFSGVKLRNSANQSIPNNTQTALTFDTEIYDTDNFHSTVTNTSRITVPIAGKYRLTATLDWATNSTGIRYIWVLRNGTTIECIVGCLPITAGASTTPQQTTATVDAAAGDYFEVIGLQTSGISLNSNATSPYAPMFECELVK